MKDSAPAARDAARLAAPALDADPSELRLEKTPTGKFNSSWFVAGGKQGAVVKVSPPASRAIHLFYEYRMMRQEPAVHERLLSGTQVKVPRVLQLWREPDGFEGRDVILLERLEGEPLGRTAASRDHVLRQVGEALAQVHTVRGRRYGYDGAHRPMEPRDAWWPAFEMMWNLLMDDLTRCGGYRIDEAGDLRGLLAKYRAAFDHDPPAALLHMDIWDENILADDEGLTGLVDWDRALYGDPEIEFAVLDYCGISTSSFWQGYGAVRPSDRAAQIRRLFYLLYEVQKYIVIYTARTPRPERAAASRRLAASLIDELR